jgi:cell wall assembly regulator SMI1
LGIEFPEAVRTSYRVHDGQHPDFPGVMGGWELLSLDQMLMQWRAWKDLLDSDALEGLVSEPAEAIQPDWWNSRWIPLTHDGGNHHCLDFSSTAAGQIGQVINMWHDSSDRVVVAPNFQAWLASFATDLEAGGYVFSQKSWIGKGGLSPIDEWS